MVNFDSVTVMTRIGNEVFGFEYPDGFMESKDYWHMSVTRETEDVNGWCADIVYAPKYNLDRGKYFAIEINSLDEGALKNHMDISVFTLPEENHVETWRMITLSPQYYTMMEVKLYRAMPKECIDKVVQVADILMQEQTEENEASRQDFRNHLRSLLEESMTPPYLV